MLEVGTIVGGKFRIEKIIGRGGMGVVAIATHVQLEQRVALKVLHAPLAEDATSRDRFLREARTPMRLRSDHVCRVFDVGTLDDGAPYIVMELLEGADLASIVAHRPLAIPTRQRARGADRGDRGVRARQGEAGAGHVCRASRRRPPRRSEAPLRAGARHAA